MVRQFINLSASFLLVISLISACSCRPDTICGFDPSEADVISDMTKDLMTHCSVFKVIDDTVYFAYYHDTLQVEEHSKHTSITPVLSKAVFPFDGNFERLDVIRSGETCGSFSQDATRAPYDPNLLKVGNRLMYYFNGCVNDTVCFCVRPYDLETASFEEEVYKCTVKFRNRTMTLDSYSLFSIMREIGHDDVVFTNDVVMSNRFIPKDGAYYNVVANAFTTRSVPILLKTVDGINFDMVFAFDENPGGCCEAAFEFVRDEIYLLTRDHFADWHDNGMFLSKYSFRDGKCLVAPRLLTAQPSDPSLIRRGKRIYAFYNVFPEIEKNGHPVHRSRLRMAQIGTDCSLIDSLDVTYEYGIHYPYTDYIGDDIYMTFTEDRRCLSPAVRSNISMIRLDL